MVTTSRRPSALGALGLSALLALPAAAGADWLVTREGARMEIQGHWQVKGKLVVFTRMDGTLASLRLSELDLEASERATAEAMEAAVAADAEETARKEAPAAEKKKSKFSLTDADFRKPEPPPAAEGAEGEPEQAQAVTPGGQEGDEAARKEPVTVASWRQAARTEGDGLDIFGVLQNTGNELATDVAVTVELFNETGEQVGSSQAVLSAPGIRPNASVTFRAAFPSVFAFSEARFSVRSRGITLAPRTEGAEGEGPPA